ncbi:MAG: adenylyl-sulfate kinase [Clostridia bacterium]|nr:adenylyl-sulfate kinase [Clostridia bacterium]
MTNILQQINSSLKSDPKGFIAVCEKSYKEQINRLADAILSDENNRILMIAGPSGSGKTTTAHVLKETLEKKGKKTQVISLDNFFKNLCDRDVLPDGSVDFESVNALNIDEITRSFNQLITNGKSKLPEFDFLTAKSIPDKIELDISDGGLFIVEGIHALNPEITRHLPKEKLFKIYVSVTRPIVDDNGKTVLTGRKLRLIRRIIRDFKFRNKTINETLGLWSGVVEAENKHIRSFKKYADFCVTTLHAYEPALYKKSFLEMIEAVTDDTPNSSYARAAAKGLESFAEIDEKLIPETSLIKEFIG